MRKSASSSTVWLIVTTLTVAACTGGLTSDQPNGKLAQRKAALTGAQTLSGTVFGGGAPLAGASVEALADGTTTALASSVTDGGGHYALALDAGTYDLRVTPPSGSFQQMVQDVTVTQDRVYDIILIEASVGVQGTITGHLGAGVGDIHVNAQDPDTGLTVASATSDASGVYSLNVGSGTYRFYLYRNASDSLAAPRYFYGYRFDVVVSGATILDISLPVVRVQGHVTDANGSVAGAVIGVSSGYNASNASFTTNDSTSSDGDGHYEFFTLAGNASFTVTPPAASGDAVLLENNVSLSADATRDFVLSSAQPVSGVVKGHDGAGVGDVHVSAQDPDTGLTVASTTSDASGVYSLNVGSGTYRFYVYRNASDSLAAPRYFYGYRFDVVVAGATPLDISLPVVRVQGHVTDANGSVAGAVIGVSSGYNASNASFTTNDSTSSDGDGHYEFFTLAGNASFTVTPPAASGDAVLLENNVSLSADATRDFVLSSAQPVSGVVKGYGGAGVGDVHVSAQDPDTGLTVASTTSDASGVYSLNVGSGTYRFYVYRNASDSLAAPRYFYGYRFDVVVAGATPLDISLPVVRVEGHVTDANGAPVPGASASVSSGYNDSNASFTTTGSEVSDAMGQYQLVTLSGHAGFTIAPPSASGFATTLIANVALASDRTQAVILQHSDLSPPVITAGPLVIHLSDTSVSINWTTNEASTSRVEFGVGALTATVDQPGLTTAHAVTLVGLRPSTDYSYRAGSIDGSGNGPTQTSVLSFRTQDPPGDVSMPLITSGPTVTFVSDTIAIVSWQTDEPASSVVRFGTNASLGGTESGPSGAFSRDHSVALSGLSPSTEYFAQVESTDPDGNGPTESGLIQFQTQATPDTTSPAILAGPTIGGFSDHTISVSWTTDEPSTSGVSYNDGSVFDLASDAALVTKHVMTLSNLKPSTVYHLTVSSTDPVGNGPTLGETVDVTTAAAPDTTPPVLSGVSVIDASGTTATVIWSTDEPSSSSVAFGTVPGEPDGVRADVTMMTAHEVLLTGLVPGHTYYLTASSTDASGNPASSGETSFTVGALAGAPCLSALQCATGYCVNGVCCSSACNGACLACSIAAGAPSDGTCAPKPSGASCGPTPGLCELSGVCDAALACSAPTPRLECLSASVTECEDGSACKPSVLPGPGPAIKEMSIEFREPINAGEASVQPCGAVAQPTDGYRIVSDSTGSHELVCLDLEVSDSVGYSQKKLIRVCMVYSDTILDDGMGGKLNENLLELYHDDGFGWLKVTSNPRDPEHNKICGEVSSLSPFAIAVPIDTTPPVFGNVPALPIVAYATSTAGAKVTYTQPTAIDAVEGVRPVTCTTASGAVASGATFPLGKTVVTCSASDTRTNVASASFTVWVQVQSPSDGTFFGQPVNPDGSSIFKRGSTIPVKFRLTGASAGLTNLVARLSVAKVSSGVAGTFVEPESSAASDSGATFRYDGGQYIFNLSTKNLSTGTYSLRVDLGDLVDHQVRVSLR